MDRCQYLFGAGSYCIYFYLNNLDVRELNYNALFFYFRSLFSSSSSGGSAFGSKLLLQESPVFGQSSSSASNRMQYGRILWVKTDILLHIQRVWNFNLTYGKLFIVEFSKKTEFFIKFCLQRKHHWPRKKTVFIYGVVKNYKNN